jgi:uncharacterized membrane protein
MANDNNVMVVAYFANEDIALGAAEHIKNWDDANDDIKLGAIAVLTLNPDSGEIESKDVGQRNTKRGALWGTAIGATVGILSAGIALIPGLLLGAGGGSVVGAMSHKDVGMTDEDRARMADKLRGGGAALAVMADDFEVAATKAEMTRYGGTPESYGIPEATVKSIATAVVAQEEAAETVDENAGIDTDYVAEAAAIAGIEFPTAAEAQVSAKNAAIVAGILATTGLTAEDASKARAAGVDKPSTLLIIAATPEGRAELSEATGIDAEKILAAVKLLDLMRIKGVGITFARLLQAAGVATVPDLAQRNAANLRTSMQEANDASQIVVELPYEETVGVWVAQAKELPRVINY